jgi:hypothetical protein
MQQSPHVVLSQTVPRGRQATQLPERQSWFGPQSRRSQHAVVGMHLSPHALKPASHTHAPPSQCAFCPQVTQATPLAPQD